MQKKKRKLGKLVSDKGKLHITTDIGGYAEIFELDPNLEVSFFPNGSADIWVNDKESRELGMRLRFSRGEKGLMIEINGFMFSEPIKAQTILNNNSIHIIQLKKNTQKGINIVNAKISSRFIGVNSNADNNRCLLTKYIQDKLNRNIIILNQQKTDNILEDSYILTVLTEDEFVFLSDLGLIVKKQII